MTTITIEMPLNAQYADGEYRLSTTQTGYVIRRKSDKWYVNKNQKFSATALDNPFIFENPREVWKDVEMIEITYQPFRVLTIDGVEVEG